jgi:hypothetical protein
VGRAATVAALLDKQKRKKRSSKGTLLVNRLSEKYLGIRPRLWISQTIPGAWNPRHTSAITFLVGTQHKFSYSNKLV